MTEELKPLQVAKVFNFVVNKEGFRAKAYPDPGSPLAKECQKRKIDFTRSYTSLPNWKLYSGSPWTIGYGFTTYKGRPVEPTDTITKEEADKVLNSHIQEKYRFIKNNVLHSLNINQVTALISFIFNIGNNAFLLSTLRRKLNEGKIIEASNQFPRWNRDDSGISQGLINRRAKEKDLFDTPSQELV